MGSPVTFRIDEVLRMAAKWQVVCFRIHSPDPVSTLFSLSLSYPTFAQIRTRIFGMSPDIILRV